MVKPEKEFWIKGAWLLAAIVTLIAAVNNTVFPIIHGEPAYAVFNLVVCAIAGVTEYRKIKEIGGKNNVQQ